MRWTSLILGISVLWGCGEQPKPAPPETSKKAETDAVKTEPAPHDASAEQPSVEVAPADPAIPYGIDKRPMPAGEKMGDLLPEQVGPYRRNSLRLAPNNGHDHYASYMKPDAKGFVDFGVIAWGDSNKAKQVAAAHDVFVSFGVTGSAAEARRVLETVRKNSEIEFPDATRTGSMDGEPSFFKDVTPNGASMNWTRGRYYFLVHAKGGEAALDAFMKALAY